jgi:uncharacterized membrane protein YfcA
VADGCAYGPEMPGDDNELPALVRYAFWIYAAILAVAIAIGAVLQDNDLTFAIAGAGGAVWLVWAFYVLTNRRGARDRLAESHRAQRLKVYPAPTLVGGLSALVVGALFIGLAIMAAIGQVP